MVLTVHRIVTLAIISVIIVSIVKFERSRLATSQIRIQDLKRKKLYVSDLNQLLSSILFDQSLPSLYSLHDFDFDQTIPDISGNWTIKHGTGSSFEYMRSMCLGTTSPSRSNGNLDAKWVRFQDSNLPWIVSRCNRHTGALKTGDGSLTGESSDVSWSYALSYLSRIPLPLRKHVRVIMVAPVSWSPLFKRTHGTRINHSSMPISESTTHAIEPHGLLSHDAAIFFGEPSFGTWIHEFSHAVDLHAGHFSSSSKWLEAIEKDECIADEYASSSPEELQWNAGDSIGDQQKPPIYYPGRPIGGPLNT
ncbi:1435_t:CDS:2, partial [Acaulospora colombiana]